MRGPPHDAAIDDDETWHIPSLGDGTLGARRLCACPRRCFLFCAGDVNSPQPGVASVYLSRGKRVGESRGLARSRRRDERARLLG